MTGAEIHNGVVVQDVPGVVTEQLPVETRAPAPSPDSLSPDQIAAAMAWCLDELLYPKLGDVDPSRVTPMALVNALLQLKDDKGQKLVFTRWDLFQCFAIWSKKLAGAERVSGEQ